MHFARYRATRPPLSHEAPHQCARRSILRKYLLPRCLSQKRIRAAGANSHGSAHCSRHCRISALAPLRTFSISGLSARRWHASAAAERANFQSFCNELCNLLAVPRPDPARKHERNNAYVYDETVWFDDGDGKRTANFVDLYKRGCFVMEAKQGSEADDGGANPV